MTEYQISTLYGKINGLSPLVTMFGAELSIDFTVDFNQNKPISDSIDIVLETYNLADRVLNKLEIPHDGIDYTPDNLSLSIQMAKKVIDYFKFHFYSELRCNEDKSDYDLMTKEQWFSIPKEFKKIILEKDLPVELRRLRSKISIIIDWGKKISGYELEEKSRKLLGIIKPLMLDWGIADDNIYATGEVLVKEYMNFKPTDCIIFNFYNVYRIEEG